MTAGLAAGLLSAFVFGVAAVAQAQGVRRVEGDPDRLGSFVARSVRDPWTLAVVAAYLVGFVLHAVAIWLLPLYLAQATVAMSLPVTALASRRLAERLSASQWLSVALVSGGLVLLALGAGDVGTTVTSPAFASALWAGFAVLGLLALASGRVRGVRLAAMLGTVAGLGYAGSAIAVRGVGTPVTVPVLASALAVPCLSLIAFWLYSRGMHAGAVASATAPMIVGQTVVPALLGVLLLGDTVRAGWTWSILLGLLLSIIGAVRLASAAEGPGQDAGQSSEVATQG